MTLRLGEYPGISRWAQDNYKTRKAKKKKKIETDLKVLHFLL